MIRSLIYLLFMTAFLQAILYYLKDNWDVISHAPIASALLFFVGFLFGYLWLQREVNANKAETSAHKAETSSLSNLLKLKEAEYLNSEKNIKTKDEQIKDLTEKISEIKSISKLLSFNMYAI